MGKQEAWHSVTCLVTFDEELTGFYKKKLVADRLQYIPFSSPLGTNRYKSATKSPWPDSEVRQHSGEIGLPCKEDQGELETSGSLPFRNKSAYWRTLQRIYLDTETYPFSRKIDKIS
jgi:hypothetical protein